MSFNTCIYIWHNNKLFIGQKNFEASEWVGVQFDDGKFDDGKVPI